MKAIEGQDIRLLFRWLSIAALAEWLISRTATRAAIYAPKSPAMIAGYQAFNLAGQVAGTFATLLLLVLLVWLIRQEWRARRAILLPLAIIGLVALSLIFLVMAPSAWLGSVHGLLTLAFVLSLGSKAVYSSFRTSATSGQDNHSSDPAVARIAAFSLPALALLAAVLYQFLPSFYTALGWPGPPPLTGLLFNAGEVLVVLSGATLWWIYGRRAAWHHWLLAAIPALLFILSFQRDAAMTGILAIWSTGLTLFLPWPVYALALWLASVTVLATWNTNWPVACAILLLVSAGYAPQLSTQLFSALTALWLLAGPAAIQQPVAQAPSSPGQLRLAAGKIPSRRHFAHDPKNI